MTIVGAGALSSRPLNNAMMRMREATGGKFGNLILANVATQPGIRIDNCTNPAAGAIPDTPPSIVSVLPAASVSLGTYLFFSSNNIIQSPAVGFQIVAPCTGTAPSFVNTDPLIFGGTFTETSTDPIDPRPACGSAAYSNVDPVPNGDAFFSTTTYKGAFGSVNWLDGWSLFNLPSRRGFVRSSLTCPTGAGTSAQAETVSLVRTVEISMRAQGTAATTDTNAIKQTTATRLSVPASDVTVKVQDVPASAGRLRALQVSQVDITISISVPTAAAATAVESTANSLLTSAAAASSIFGITVTTSPTVAARSVLAPTATAPTGDTPNKLPDYGIGIIIGISILAAIVCCIVVHMYRQEKAGRPIFTTISKNISVRPTGVSHPESK
jgi:hypothetical protein